MWKISTGNIGIHLSVAHNVTKKKNTCTVTYLIQFCIIRKYFTFAYCNKVAKLWNLWNTLRFASLKHLVESLKYATFIVAYLQVRRK